eukprot:395824-Amphidinium_carterae.1
MEFSKFGHLMRKDVCVNVVHHETGWVGCGSGDGGDLLVMVAFSPGPFMDMALEGPPDAYPCRSSGMGWAYSSALQQDCAFQSLTPERASAAMSASMEGGTASASLAAQRKLEIASLRQEIQTLLRLNA